MKTFKVIMDPLESQMHNAQIPEVKLEVLSEGTKASKIHPLCFCRKAAHEEAWH